MSITAAQLVVEVSAKGIEGVEHALKGVGKSAEDAKGHSDGFLKKIFEFAGGNLVAQGLGKAVGFVTDNLGDMLQKGIAANDAIAQTAAVLKSTHGAAGVTSQHVEDLSNKLMNLTGIQDDTVTSTQNMLLTFTNIGSKGGIFDQATQTALDMSTALGQDTKSSAIQLGKALNDPVHGITALQRVGVTFNKSQKDMIATMMKHGDVAGAQKVILGELNKEFGGSAVAAGNANGGIKKLSAQFDQMKQTVGQAMIPILDKLMTAIEPIVQQFAQWLPGALQKAGDFINKNIMPIISALGDWFQKQGLPLLQKFGDFVVTKVIPAVKQMADWFGKHVMPVLQTLWDVFTKNILPALEDVWTHVQQKLIPALQRLWEKLEPLLIPVLRTLGFIFQNVVGPALGGAVDVISKVVDAISTLIDWIEKLFGWLGKIKDAVGGAFGKLGDNIHTTFHALHIPGFAGGGTMQDTGLAVVGERGPELMQLPRGTRITPMSDARSLMSTPQSLAGGFGGATQQIVIQLDGRTLAAAVVREMPRQVRLSTGLKI